MNRNLVGSLVVMLASANFALAQTRMPDVATPPTIASPPTESVADQDSGSRLGVEDGNHGSCGPDGCARKGDRFWFSAEYLLWWIRDGNVPPLVTAGTPASQGILGLPGTRILVGGELEQEERSGGRFAAGFWLDDCRSCGLEARFFFLGERHDTAAFGPDTAAVLARPFFDFNSSTEVAELATFPGLAQGAVAVSNPTRLWGAEVNAVKQPCCCRCSCYQVDAIAGFRYIDFDESVNIAETIKVDPNPTLFPGFASLANSTIFVGDGFSVRNQFYGGQAGFDASTCWGRWGFNLRSTLALGVTHEVVTIGGSQTIVSPTGTATNFSGGLLALASNSGRFTQDKFAVVPEVGLNVGYRLTNCLGVFFGYNFLYWSRVVRAGDQIDRVVDVSQIPNFAPGTAPTGIIHPAASLRQTDFWAQGLDFGVELHW
jgi:hypothetical protein